MHQPTREFVVRVPWYDVATNRPYIWTAGLHAASLDEAQQMASVLLEDESALLEAMAGKETAAQFSGPRRLFQYGLVVGDPIVLSVPWKVEHAIARSALRGPSN